MPALCPAHALCARSGALRGELAVTRAEAGCVRCRVSDAPAPGVRCPPVQTPGRDPWGRGGGRAGTVRGGMGEPGRPPGHARAGPLAATAAAPTEPRGILGSGATPAAGAAGKRRGPRRRERGRRRSSPAGPGSVRAARGCVASTSAPADPAPGPARVSVPPHSRLGGSAPRVPTQPVPATVREEDARETRLAASPGPADPKLCRGARPRLRSPDGTCRENTAKAGGQTSGEPVRVT